MFEPENGPPGEFRLFREREGLSPLDLGEYGLEHCYANEDQSLLAMVAGVGTANTAISVMTLGTCECLDLRHSFWMVAGIAGGNPHRCSLGSPVWADWVVDGDLAFEFDAREIPQEWSTGILPLGAKEPFGPSSMSPELFGRPYQMFQLNPQLCKKALELTREIELADDPAVGQLRQAALDFPPAQKAPLIQIGASLSAARFWHGPRHNTWAEQWTGYWTGEKGRFHTSAMEDSGTLHALAQLDRMGKADSRRSLILRTVSNFTMPVNGSGIVSSLTVDSHDGQFPAQSLAFENSFRAASTVYRNIFAELAIWENTLR